MGENLDKWQEVESEIEYWRPEQIGDTLIGTVLEKIEGEFGPQYKLEKEDGKTALTPSHRVLQSRMSGVALGTKVKIFFESELQPKVRGQNPTKIYKVFLEK